MISRNFFKKINRVTILVTLFLIFVGGFVRSSGSGMGCPDWPKCFGFWIPPTSQSELPSNYAEQFVEGRLKKNERFAQLLDKVGKHELAQKVRNDVSIREHEPFNAVKTWIEYLNRLVGASLGILFLLTAISSIAYWQQHKRITVLSFINVFVVAYQAWLGAIVVSTNLLQWLVTAHMMLALVLLMILIYNHFKVSLLSYPKHLVHKKTTFLKWIGFSSVLILIVQIVIGTEVREALDVIAKSTAYAFRDTWVSKLGYVFFIHRDLALVITILNGFIVWQLRSYYAQIKMFNKLSILLIVIVFLQLVSGIILSYLGLPSLIQPMHLTLSFLLFSVQYYLLLNLSYTRVLVQKS